MKILVTHHIEFTSLTGPLISHPVPSYDDISLIHQGVAGYRYFTNTCRSGDKKAYVFKHAVTPWTYIGGTIYTFAEAVNILQDQIRVFRLEQFIAIMQNNACSQAVQTKYGQFIPLAQDDKVVEEGKIFYSG